MSTERLCEFQDRLTKLMPLAEALAAMTPVERVSRDYEDGFTRPDAFSTEYVHYYTNYCIDLAPADLADIITRLDARHVLEKFGEFQHAIDYLVSMLETRLANLVNGVAFNVVSLGCDCLPRSVPTKWGLKPPKNLGELTMPFDLGVHPAGAIIEILEADFVNYPPVDEAIYSERHGFPIVERTGILWNHEVGSRWAEKNFAPLVERYCRRINNFRKKLNDGRPTVLVLYLNTPFSADLRTQILRIARAARRLGGNPMALSAFCSSTEAPLDLLGHEYERIDLDGMPVEIRRLVLPYSWYMWFEHKNFTLPGGMLFERQIIAGVRASAEMISS